MNEVRYGVWLYSDRIGTLNQRGDYVWFRFASDYLDNPRRAVLGLAFEDDLSARHARALKLPPWFSNLLPEGVLRDWVAADRGVSPVREMELLAQVGRDLPGAVRVLPEDEPPEGLEGDPPVDEQDPREGSGQNGWRFSLAGVGLKFSMVHDGDRLTLPANGQGGDWIVKLPDTVFADVPLNEHAMMTLASKVGIDVPEHRLVPLDQLSQLPGQIVRQTREGLAYAVRRFDRPGGRRLVHIEDLAQVLGKFTPQKYEGNFETVASIAYRGRDEQSLYEFVRRLTLNILITNGDAHLKNWSLIYLDKRAPRLSPAYDIVSTGFYREQAHGEEDLGLRFARTRRFEAVSLFAFERLEGKLGADGLDLAGCARETVELVQDAWPSVASLLDPNAPLRDSIDASIAARTRSLLGSRL